jgi:hypothetical protein
VAISDKFQLLEAERIELEARLAEKREKTEVLALHPTAMTKYLEQVENLSAALQNGLRMGAGSSAYWFRSLVERVVVHPVRPRAPLDIEVRGYMAQLVIEPRLPPNGRFSVGERPET